MSIVRCLECKRKLDKEDIEWARDILKKRICHECSLREQDEIGEKLDDDYAELQEDVKKYSDEGDEWEY